VPHINSWESCYFAQVPDDPQTYTLNVLWLQEEGAQIHVSIWSQSFTFTKNVGQGFFLCFTPTQWTVWQPFGWRCLLRVLCAVSRPVTVLDCVLLKGRNLALAPRHGPEISSRACLWLSPRPRHHSQCWLTNQRLILRLSSLETPRACSGPTNSRTGPPLASSSAISLPRTPVCPGTQYSPTVCRVEISFNAFWHCWTSGDVVLMAWRTFKAAWLSEQILTYFSGLFWNWVS